MPGGASKLCDVSKLADSRSTLDLDIPVAQLPGLPVELISGAGQVHAHLQFGREKGFMMAQVTLRGQLQLICQRCMQPMTLQLDVHSPVLLLQSEADADGAPVEWETYLAADGRLSPDALVAEELLLALPVVPLHDESSACEPGAAVVEPEPVLPSEPPSEVEATTRPFADLRALLDRGAKTKT